MRNSPSKTNGRSMSEPFDSDGGQCGGSSAPTLEALYRTYAARLLGTLRAECDGNLEDAKDLSQRIWLVIARRLQTITIEHPWPFIEKVMTDEVNGAFRLKSRRNGKLDLLVPLIEPVKPPELKETSPELWGCLERLSQLDQSIVMSFYGLSRRQSRGGPVHVSRPTPPYLRVVSNRAFQLEVEEEEPPQPLTDEEQAQALTEERQETWSPRRVKVRRCRALSALALCLKEHGLTGSSQRSPWKEEDTGEGGESMETSRGPLRQLLTRSSPSGDDSDEVTIVHPPTPLLLLTFGETGHPVQQHLQACSRCQASLAALQSVEAQLMQASQLHRAHWERLHEERLALEDVWATLQLTLSTDDSPAVAVQLESPFPSAPQPQELPEEPILIVETEEAGAEVGIPSAPSGPTPQQDSNPTAKLLRLPHISRGWKVLGGIALAAGLLLALGLGRLAADPFGLGDAGQTRGGGADGARLPDGSGNGEAWWVPSISWSYNSVRPNVRLQMFHTGTGRWEDVRFSLQEPQPDEGQVYGNIGYSGRLLARVASETDHRIGISIPRLTAYHQMLLLGDDRTISGSLNCFSDPSSLVQGGQIQMPVKTEHLEFLFSLQAGADIELLLPKESLKLAQNCQIRLSVFGKRKPTTYIRLEPMP